MNTDKPPVIVASSIKNKAISEEDRLLEENRVLHVRPWPRFFARNLDYLIYTFVTVSILLICIMKFPSLEMVLSKNQLKFISIILMFASWILMESFQLSAFGSTIGKYLFKIQVRNIDGSIPTFTQALKRTCLVSLKGVGLGIPIITWITMFLSYQELVKTGTTSWDKDIFIITHGEPEFPSIMIAVLIAMAAVFTYQYFKLHVHEIGIRIAAKQDYASFIYRANKVLPLQLGNGLVLQKIYFQDNAINLNVRLVDKSVDQINVDAFISSANEQTKEKACREKEYRLILDQNTNVIYHFTDDAGTPIADITISKSDCQ